MSTRLYIRIDNCVIEWLTERVLSGEILRRITNAGILEVHYTGDPRFNFVHNGLPPYNWTGLAVSIFVSL
ncbi:MAG: hypothetical protein OXI72_05900, partial [Gemmatimonadota bacterium]|nr:hypothetical protein [Gemmatimonadota bacterium]